MKFNSGFFEAYLRLAPMALAIERTMECRLLCERPFERPVLDIGCGEGLFASVLFAEQVDTGIDPNARELERARELGAYRELIQCGGAAIPKQDGIYRTIFSNSVLEHIPDLAPVLREAYRLLAPGGRFYLTVPSDAFERYSAPARILGGLGLESLCAAYRRFYNRFWAHYHCYTLEEWSAMARTAGFEVVEAFRYGSAAVCTFDDLLAPVALPRMIIKKMTNRWVLVPRLRHVLMTPARLLTSAVVARAGKDPDGGLVFLTLTKE